MHDADVKQHMMTGVETRTYKKKRSQRVVETG